MKYKLVTPVSEIPEDVLSKKAETAVDEDSSEDENSEKFLLRMVELLNIANT